MIALIAAGRLGITFFILGLIAFFTYRYISGIPNNDHQRPEDMDHIKQYTKDKLNNFDHLSFRVWKSSHTPLPTTLPSPLNTPPHLRESLDQS